MKIKYLQINKQGEITETELNTKPQSIDKYYLPSDVDAGAFF